MAPTIQIVGAGIMGLAHAWTAAERGWRVRVFDRTAGPQAASIRNFGMIWPIGQPAGEPYQLALASRERWLALARLAGIRVEPCGSLHLAYRDDELAVLEEFADRAGPHGYDVRLLTAAATRERSPAPRAAGLLAGLQTNTELAVDPVSAVPALAAWLADACGVEFQWETTVLRAAAEEVEAADGRCWRGDRTLVCSGADFETLFPEVLRASGLTRCKLQMLATVPQPPGWRLGPHIASGLTLRHYPAFAICPSLSALRQRIAAETPELDRFGIHVMASQNWRGEVILGDSHEYDAAISPFDSTAIDGVILREIRRCLDLPDWTIGRRWHGIYAKNPAGLQLAAEPVPGVSIRVAPGGAGMTLAFGLAQREWQGEGAIHNTGAGAANA